MNLTEYNDKILKPMMVNHIDVLYGTLKLSDFPPPKPLTRWQKFKRQMSDYKQRAKDIWMILRGRDIHENCGDY